MSRELLRLLHPTMLHVPLLPQAMLHLLLFEENLFSSDTFLGPAAQAQAHGQGEACGACRVIDSRGTQGPHLPHLLTTPSNPWSPQATPSTRCERCSERHRAGPTPHSTLRLLQANRRRAYTYTCTCTYTHACTRRNTRIHTHACTCTCRKKRAKVLVVRTVVAT